jgi:hypothetical protein
MIRLSHQKNGDSVMDLMIKNITTEIEQDMVAYIQHLVKTYPNLTPDQLSKYLVEYGKMMNYEVEEAA